MVKPSFPARSETSSLSSVPPSPQKKSTRPEFSKVPSADEDEDEDSENERSDGADSVTLRIRQFNAAKTQPLATQSSITPSSTKKRKAPADPSSSEAESTDEYTEKRKGQGKKVLVKKKGKIGKKAAIEVKKKPEKKVLRAKVVVWDDLPDWGDRTDCPLLEMLPCEVLDRCFDGSQTLQLRDWISLAGVCHFFREHLDDLFFHELWYLRGNPNRLMTLIENRPDAHPARHPFTRNSISRRVDPTRAPTLIASPEEDDRTTLPSDTSNPHYIPRGPRISWTREQYTIYKEEKMVYAEEEAARRTILAESLAIQAEIDRKRLHRIHVSGQTRRVHATVMGRGDGEEAVQKNGNGLPVIDDIVAQPAGKDEEALTEDEDELGSGSEVGKMAEVRMPKPRLSRAGQELWDAAQIPMWMRYPRAEWTVPETDGEDEIGPLRPNLYRPDGLQIFDDYWPSEWRARIAEEVNDTWMNQTRAVKTFRVSKAELITLRHVLIPNPLSSKQPQQMFLCCAVESLAYRSHGGLSGHKQHMAISAIRSEKAVDASEDRRKKAVREARAAGKPIPKRPHVMSPLTRVDMIRCGGSPGWMWCDDRCWCMR